MKITKENGTKKHCHKKTLKFEDYKSCLEVTQLDNKTNQLQNHKLAADSLRKTMNNLKKAIS